MAAGTSNPPPKQRPAYATPGTTLRQPPGPPAETPADPDDPTPSHREGASIGKSARSTAGGAAGQLKPKD